MSNINEYVKIKYHPTAKYIFDNMYFEITYGTYCRMQEGDLKI